jgi:hypothetical protein
MQYYSINERRALMSVDLRSLLSLTSVIPCCYVLSWKNREYWLPESKSAKDEKRRFKRHTGLGFTKRNPVQHLAKLRTSAPAVIP